MDQLVEQTEAPSTGKVTKAYDFLVETRAELDKVSWPPREELIKATKAVTISALVLGVVIGLLDLALKLLLVDGIAALRS